MVSILYHLQKEKCCGAICSAFWSTSWEIKNLQTIVRIPMQICRQNILTFKQHSLPWPCPFHAYQQVDLVSSARYEVQKCLRAIGPTSPLVIGSPEGYPHSCRKVQTHETCHLHEQWFCTNEWELWVSCLWTPYPSAQTDHYFPLQRQMVGIEICSHYNDRFDPRTCSDRP